MYYQQALQPNELLPALSDSGECLFVIRAELPLRNYEVAVYRYDNQYFLLQDEALFAQIDQIANEKLGDEEEILPYIEDALEDNHYILVEKAFIRLDLSTLQKMKDLEYIDILFYEFIDSWGDEE
ncbi:hypothetical protein IGI41_001486 [Enterococcus sp. DIV0876]